MTYDELQTILDGHKKWLRNEEGGERADLSGADLRGFDLGGVNFIEANLKKCDFRKVELSYALLRQADLREANLSEADLFEADLRGANLQGANLRGANLRFADLDQVNLREANLQTIKDDLFSILEAARSEVPGLLKALKEGRVDGSTYEGDCACLVGTIANIRGVDYKYLNGIKPDLDRPAEYWFLAIRKGDTPESNPIAKITLEWIEEFASKSA